MCMALVSTAVQSGLGAQLSSASVLVSIWGLRGAGVDQPCETEMTVACTGATLWVLMSPGGWWVRSSVFSGWRWY